MKWWYGIDGLVWLSGGLRLKTCTQCRVEFEDTVDECPQHKSALQPNNSNPLIGTCLADRYQIISVIGSGGTGVVYKGHHLKMDRSMAIKMMHSHMVARPDALKRFYEEAKTIAQLKHHNIITLFDFGIGPNNQPFLVMDYIEGPSLKKQIENNGPLSMEEMRTILAQVVDGLAYAHSEGIVHQDLKPENIMLTKVNQSQDKVTLVDFGMATLHMQDKEMATSGNKKKKFIGSPYYMSPEQCFANVPIDNRTDIYSLAIVLYEALSGKLPYEAKSGIAMMDSHVRETPIPLKLSNPELSGLQICTEVTRVFNHAMAKEPENRYSTISDFGAQLDEALVRDIAKWKAIKHRSVAAEQVFVHAQQINQRDEVPTRDLSQTLTRTDSLESQMQSGRQFLSCQAEIEAAYLNPITNNETKQTNAVYKEPPNGRNALKDNIITKLFKRMKNSCNKTPLEAEIPAELSRQVIQCPYCQTPVPTGIQFCLNCQRKLATLTWTNKLPLTRTGIASTHCPSDEVGIIPEANRNNIQNLRQQRLMSLDKIQRALNYALIAAIVFGGIVIVQNYFTMSNPLKTLGQLIHSPAKSNSVSIHLDSSGH